MVCAVSPYSRNVLPLGGASERSSAGPSTHSFTMGGTTSGNLSILVMTLITCLENFLQPHNTHQRSSSALRMHLKALTSSRSPSSYVSNYFYRYLILTRQQTDTRCVPSGIFTVRCSNLDMGGRPKSCTAIFALFGHFFNHLFFFFFYCNFFNRKL